jgi:8-oxo-dGTP diphosphatase
MALKVACALIISNNKILITQRPFHKNQGGKWEFPGGKLHENETAAECIVREIMEELELDIEVVKELDSITHHYPSFTIELIPIICSIKSGSLTLREHIGSKWVKIEELQHTDLCDADKKILSLLERPG